MNYLRRLILILLMSSNTTAGIASDLGDVLNEDRPRPCKVLGDSVFYVHIFGGTLPIPNRYIAVIGSSPIIELNSLFEPGHPSSFIRVGPMQDYMETIAPEYSNRNYIEEEFNGLHVKIFAPPNNVPLLKNTTTVLIHDGSQFFLITGDDPHAWKAIINGLKMN